jgi:hypothetical protein
MKKGYNKNMLLLILVVAAVLPMAMHAQKLTSQMLVDGKVWKMKRIVMGTFPLEAVPHHSDVLYGDTLIEGKKWKKLYTADYEDGIPATSSCALYEEGKKVYCYYYRSKQTRLLYDFGCAVGDTLTCSESKVKVMETDTIEIDGELLRRIYVSELDEQGELTDSGWPWGSVWVEGVGAVGGVISPVLYPGNYYNLEACEIDGRAVFMRPQFYASGITGITSPKVSPAHSDANSYDLGGRPTGRRSGGIGISKGKKLLHR